jgi:hypothetical protein
MQEHFYNIFLEFTNKDISQYIRMRDPCITYRNLVNLLSNHLLFSVTHSFANTNGVYLLPS